MKTYEQYQEILAAAIKTHDTEKIRSVAEVKKSITIRAEHNGEVYQTEFDASLAFVALGVDHECNARGASNGLPNEMVVVVAEILKSLPEEVRFQAMQSVIVEDMMQGKEISRGDLK